jgi:8-oxo-dGTP diphosphatase
MVGEEALDNPAGAPQGASVVVLRRDSVLMVRRARPPLQGLWSFPGGRAEPGEDAEATARRELVEETGLAVGPLARLGAFRPAPEFSALVLTVFAARAGVGEPRAGDDAVEAEFVPFESVLARPLTPGAPGWIARAVEALAPPLR